MLDPRISFKNRSLAGILAFLIPGAGHLYQGRIFKGLLCLICIVSTFIYGQYLGDWGVVYWKRDPNNFLNPYYAQFFVGLPALPALVQARRYDSRDNLEESMLDAPIDAPFHGTIANAQGGGAPDGTLEGMISLKPEGGAADRNLSGEFTGTLTKSDGSTVEARYTLGGAHLGKPVSADPQRPLVVEIVDPKSSPPTIGELRGGIPRRLADRFEAPPDEEYNLRLQRDLGKFYELALTFTMIAGLLNILVVLDAVEGPAYGYGDTETSADADSKRPPQTAGAPPDVKSPPAGGPQPAKPTKIPNKT